MKKILLIEDHDEMSRMIQTILSNEYQIIPAFSGTEGILLFTHDSFDLILLDRMLPGKNGEEVLTEIRQKSQVPIIMLTAINDKSEVAQLLLQGANDYLTKPFDINELKARIAVQLRQSANINTTQQEDNQSQWSYKNITLHPHSFSISNQEKEIQLKRKEFEILEYLIQHPKQIFTKENLYQAVWKESYYGDENTINVHISNLRKKIKELDAQHTYIDTVWGIGVKLAEEENK